MKKSNLFAGLMGLAFMGTSFGLTSCADDRNDLTNTTNNNETLTASANQDVADYTLIMYSCGGGNLDPCFVYQLYTGYTGMGKNVKMAGVFKASKHIQQSLKGTDMAGVRYFEDKLKNVADSAALASAIRKDEIEDSIADLNKDEKVKKLAQQKAGLAYYQDFNKYFVNEKYDDETMDMGNPNNIAEAIKYVAKKNPAKHYILITDNHGGGWKFVDDRPLSRGQIYDDNVLDDFKQTRGMSLDALNAGVQQSGVKFDALFCSLCLMAYIENLTGYQQNFKTCIASAELTRGCFGFGKLGKRLAAVGANISDDELFSQLASWVKNGEYKNDWGEYKLMEKDKKSDFEDMGVYDLRKIGNLTSIMKDIATWYTTAYDNAEYKRIINYAVLTSNYISDPIFCDDDSKSYSIRKHYLDLIGYTSEQIAEIYANGQYNGALMKKYQSLSEDNKRFFKVGMDYGLTFSHFVYNTIDLMKANGQNNADAAKLTQLFNSYQSTLKNMSYIKCSHEDFPGMDPYLWTSPTIMIHPLNNTKTFRLVEIDNLGKPFNADQALASYNHTLFDQQTGWSNFLKKLTVSPTIMTNPIRSTALYETFYK